MRLLIFQITLIGIIVGLSNCSSERKFDPKDIPPHQFFIKNKIAWKASPYNDATYMTAIGQHSSDTMVIVTSNKMILIIGQYGLKPGDTVIMPYSGEFGINYQVLIRDKHEQFKDDMIKIGGQSFVSTSKAKFEWWPEIIDRIDKVGTGKVIVSGP